MATTRLRKSFSRIFKITLLIGAKEAYLFFANLLGLIYHPFLTLKKIRQEKDLSQVLLISLFILSIISFPLLLLIILLFISHLLKLNIFPHLNKVLFINLYLGLFIVITLIYLGYWIYKVILIERRN